MLPKNKTMQARRQTKEFRKEETDLVIAEWKIPVWRIERGENRRETGRPGRCYTGTESNIDEEEKEEKEAGNKKRRGQNQRGGGERWRHRESERGQRESEQEGRERGGGATGGGGGEKEEGRERREKGQHTTKTSGRSVCTM